MTEEPSQDWPFISNLELRAVSACLPTARRHAREATLRWGLTTMTDDVELVVSELVTNAVEASLRMWQVLGGSPLPVRLWLASDLDAVLVQVWDSSPEMPLRRAPTVNDERGRGLLLVGHLRRAWGTYRKGVGKVVWVAI
jgi:anti-sigma regulatory factor (Ser/Thr protein kinase)